jgi:hypothetical protein
MGYSASHNLEGLYGVLTGIATFFVYSEIEILAEQCEQEY